MITSIKGNQTVAENRQTLTTNNELGRRGISSTSGVGQQEMTNAVNPVTASYTQQIKDTTNQENEDMSAIDKAIAQLNAGNPSESVSTATGIATAIQNAANLQKQIEATQENESAQRALQLAIAKMNSQGNPYMTLGEGQIVFDPITGQVIYKNPKTYKASDTEDWG